ncbi:methyltransferase domain-containing protein [Streptomyces sp. ISL-98]|uniref:class I SAM-dependent methyltransferase n=1 Tax=Streptomyces sp. ISL-98 TaxID=2819192 RepID=UPI001BE52A39|nr:methyltransferase domain-containing protein [Streptomyces sp. ISL-98]MBT2511658.1 methyltransferase domain-containing protein [Streptomyces sp. ISL-98]
MRPSGMPSVDLLGEQITALLAEPATTHGLARTLRAAAKEIELHRYQRASRLAWPSGRIDGFFNIDAVPSADLLWDIREGIPLQDDSVAEIFSEHFLEHIDYPRSAKHYVREACRVLEPDGRIITGVPDAAFALSQYPGPLDASDGTIERWYAKRDCLGDINTRLDLVNFVFRDQDDNPKYTPHLWAYDHEKLVQFFTEAGFTTVEPWTFDPTMANPKHRWGSVYVIATK